MRCALVHKLSSTYLDGSLDDARSSALRGHLRCCDDCAQRVAEEQAIQRAAAELASKRDPNLEPSAQLWQRISADLAASEIADSEVGHGRLRLRDIAARAFPYRAHIGVAVILCLVVSVLLVRGHTDEALLTRRPVIAETNATFAASSSAGTSAETSESQFTVAARQIRQADERYLSAVTQLRELAGDDQASWSAAEKARFDRAESEFESRLKALRSEFRVKAADDPRSLDDLTVLYRRHIKFLESMVFAQVSSAEGGR